MPKKLVLDRALSIYLTGGQSVTIPEGEVWKLSLAGNVKINDVFFQWRDNNKVTGGLFTGGFKIKTGSDSASSDGVSLSGLAFKLQEV